MCERPPDPKPEFLGDIIRGETAVLDEREDRWGPAQGIVTMGPVSVDQTDQIVFYPSRNAPKPEHPA